MLPPPPASHPHHSAGRPQSYHQMPTLIPWGGSVPATEPQRPPANRQPVWEVGDGARPVPTATASVDPYVHNHTVAYPIIARTEKELQSEIHRLQGESAASTMQREVSQNELRSNIQTLEGNMLDLLREARSGSGSASVAGPTLPPQHQQHQQQQQQQQPPPAVALAVAEGARSVAQHQHPPHTPHAQTASVAAAQHTFAAQPPPPPPAAAAAAHHHHAYPHPSTPAAPRHSTHHQQPGNPSVIALEKMRSHFSCAPCASANNDPYFAAQGAHTSFLASPRAATAQTGGDASHPGTPPPAAGPSGRTLGVHRSPRRSSRWQLADTFAVNPAAFGQLSPTAAPPPQQQQPAHAAYPQQSMWQQPQQQPLHPYDASLSTLVSLPASHPSVHRPPPPQQQQQPQLQAAAPTSPLPSLRAAVAALRGERSGGGSPTPTQHQLPGNGGGGGLFAAAAAATPKRGAGDVSTLVTSPLLSGGLGGGAGGPFHLEDDAAFVNPILAGRGVSGGISESQPRHAGGSPAPDMGTSPRLLPNHGPPSAVGTSMHPPSMSTGLALISGMTEGRLGVASGSPQPSPAAVPQYPYPVTDASRRL